MNILVHSHEASYERKMLAHLAEDEKQKGKLCHFLRAGQIFLAQFM